MIRIRRSMMVLCASLMLAGVAWAQTPGTEAGTAKAAPAPSLTTPAPALSSASQPAVTPPIIPGEPLTAAEAVDKVKEGIAFGKAKNWFAMSSVVILVLVFLFKVARDRFFPTLKRRWLYIIVPVLGVTSMLLANFAGGVSWNAAWLVLTSAPAAALANDFLKRGILGQEPGQ